MIESELYEKYLSSGQIKAVDSIDKFNPYYNYIFKKFFKDKSTSIEVVDLGCGYGEFIYYLNSQGFKNTGGIEMSNNPNSHNMRSFEVPGIGGIQLAPDTIDHRKYFDPGKEIFLYTDVAECARQIFFLQSLSLEEADKLRKNARQRCLQSGYSYKEKTKQALSFIKIIKGSKLNYQT